MTPLDRIRRAADIVRDSIAGDWFGYECKNDVQDLRRLAMLVDGDEIQLNLIKHSSKPHTHGCDMVSLMLDGGYDWWLQQLGASHPVWQRSSPGSIVTMGPLDTHWIPAGERESLSLCIFSAQTDWHLRYPECSRVEILDAAKAALKRITI